MARASAVCRRLMSISGVGQVTALAFAGAIDDSSTFVDRIGDTFRWKGGECCGAGTGKKLNKPVLLDLRYLVPRTDDPVAERTART